MTNWLRVRNWEEFQHYKDRNPPWIKNYVALLTNYDYTRLGEVSRAHLHAIWLLASRSNGRIPHDVEWLGRQISATSTVDLETLIQSGFLEPVEPASTRRLQSAGKVLAPEEKRREEKNIEESQGEAGVPRAWDAAAATVRGRFPEEYRPDFDGQLRASHRPEALIAEITKILNGDEPSCPKAAPEHLGKALRDLAMAGQPLTGGRLRGFVRGAMRTPPPSRVRESNDFAAAALEAEREGQGHA